MKIKYISFKLVLLIGLSFCSNPKKENSETLVKTSSNIIHPPFDLVSVCNQFDTLNTLVRDQLINKRDALAKMKKLVYQINTLLKPNNKESSNVPVWHFPLRGYKKDAIGGKNGSGYVPGTYDYFDGNKHTGHPAHDIFIYDKNQDCIDDKSKKPVHVITVTDGVVIALSADWDSNSELRGGKYLWIFSPGANSLFYYAHNEELKVAVGESVQAGQIIATVGRTGLNAYKKRSPTHLHFMQLQFDKEGYPRPVNPYNYLLNARGI